MSETNKITHTPGPWTFDANLTGNSPVVDLLPGDRGWIFVDRHRLCLDPKVARLEMEANARLIAAAPELLAACELIDTWLEAVAKELGVSQLHSEVVAAIAKAQGK